MKKEKNVYNTKEKRMVDKMIESRKRVDLAVSALSTVKTSTVY